MVEVLLITRNRPGFLKRSLDYYASVSFSLPIVIADSSDSKYSEFVSLAVQEYSSRLNLRLLSFPESEPPFSKMVKAAELISTEFIAPVGDDDFLLEQSVRRCAGFLSDNPDYAVADGRELRFLIDSNGAFNSYVLQQLDITHDLPRHRIQAHLERYWPTFYGVHRKKNLLQFSCMVGRFDLDGVFADSVIPELYLSCLVLAEGKYKFLDGLHIVRQNEHRASTPYNSWDKLVLLPEFRDVMERFRREVSSRCLQRGERLRFLCDDAFNVGFSGFMSFFMPADGGRETYMPRPSILERFHRWRQWIFECSDRLQSKLLRRVFFRFSFIRCLVLRGALFPGAAMSSHISESMESQYSSKYFNFEEFSSAFVASEVDMRLIARYISEHPFGWVNQS